MRLFIYLAVRILQLAHQPFPFLIFADEEKTKGSVPRWSTIWAMACTKPTKYSIHVQLHLN